MEKQAKHWQELANKQEREKNLLQAQMVNFNSKPPRAQSLESNTQAQIEEIQSLRDKLFHAGEQQRDLEKTISVDLKAEIQKQMRDNERLTERNKAL